MLKLHCGYDFEVLAYALKDVTLYSTRVNASYGHLKADRLAEHLCTNV